MSDVPMLPQGCGYQGYEFGASYPDSICCGGKLYDADNCDGEGNLYEPAEDIPCPMCHPDQAVDYWTQRNGGGSAGRKAAKSLVADIRRNRTNGTVRLNEAHLADPLRWRKPAVIATAYHGDLFRLPAEQIDRAFAVMALCPQHTFLTLSKRAREMEEYFAVAAGRIGERFRKDMAIARMAPVRKIAAVKRIRALSFEESIEPLPLPLPNVYLGFSASNQSEFDARAPHVLKLAAQGWKTWVSLEPLTGPINLSTHLHCPNCGYTAHDAGMWMDHHLCGHPSPWRLRQVVLGGESGPNARPMHPDWVRRVRDDCAAAGVPFSLKQWGRYAPTWGAEEGILYADGRWLEGATHDHPDAWRNKIAEPMMRVPKKYPAELDGKVHDELAWEAPHAR